MKFVLQTSDMSRALVLFSAVCVVSVVNAVDFGNGVWEMLAIDKCEEDSHIFKFDITLLKNFNETHDACNGRIVMDEDFNRDFGVRFDVCQIEDGECKHSHTIADDCLIDFFETYAKKLTRNYLKFAFNLDPPETTISKGEYDFENYVLSTEPTIGMFGMYHTRMFILQGDNEVGCLDTQTQFKRIEGEEDKEK